MNNQIIEDYTNNNLSIRKLSKKYSRGRRTITHILKCGNVQIRKKDSRSLARTKIKQIIKLYTSGYGLVYISKLLCVHRDVIKYVLKEKNITIRTFKESIEQASKLNLNRLTMMEKYGVENPMQLNEFRRKQFKNAVKLKTLIIDGKEFVYQGYEDRAIKILIERGYCVDDIDVENVPTIEYYFNNNKHYYFPDIFLKKENKIIEVKSQFTYTKDLERNQAKFEKVKKDGYNFELMIL
jgi:hypothetical protein